MPHLLVQVFSSSVLLPNVFFFYVFGLQVVRCHDFSQYVISQLALSRVFRTFVTEYFSSVMQLGVVAEYIFIFLREEHSKLLLNKGNIGNYSNLQKLQHESDSDTTTDTTTAALCKHLRKTGTLHWSDLTFNFNTDESPLFKSSKSSVWPIQFVINKLPPSLRFQHCMLSGLWFGPKHPTWLHFSKSL